MRHSAGRLVTRGTGNAQAKLNESDVRLIRQWYRMGYYMWFLADEFEVSLTQVYRIIHRINWAHVRD